MNQEEKIRLKVLLEELQSLKQISDDKTIYLDIQRQLEDLYYKDNI